MKFKTGKTKGGYEIIVLFGPDSSGEYAGVVTDNAELFAITWSDKGRAYDLSSTFNLVPLEKYKHPLQIKP